MKFVIDFGMLLLKTSGILGGVDASRSSRLVVVSTTDGYSFVNPSETSTEVTALNVEMKNDELEEPEKNRNHVQRNEGAGTSIEVIDIKNATPASINPFTIHRVNANVTSQRTSEKRKQPEVDKKKSIYGECIVKVCCII